MKSDLKRQAEQTPEIEADRAQSARRTTGLRLVVALLVTSVGLGVFVYWRLIDSERHLAATWHDMQAIGAERGVEGCVDEVLGWSRECEAMSGLCDLSVTGMMVSCLQGQDRREYCEGLGDESYSTHFGYEECAARDLDRHERAVCAASYRAIDGHCRRLARREMP